MQEKSIKLLAIDLGFGSTKVTFRTSEGTLRFEKFVTAVANVNKGTVDVNDQNLYEFNGRFYYLFDKALKVQTSQIIQINDYESLRDVTPVIVSYLCKKYKDEYGLEFEYFAFGLSMSMADHGKEYVKHISTYLGVSEKNILLMPQGVGAKIAYENYGTNPEDDTQTSNHKATNFLGVDIGFNTIDVFPTINGTCSTNTALGIRDAGICIVADRIKEVLESKGIQQSRQDMKPVLENKSLYYRGKTINLEENVDAFGVDYFGLVVEQLEANFKSTIDKMDRIILVGGGAAFLRQYKDHPEVKAILDKNYKGDFLVFPEKPEFYNALGYYRFFEKKILGE